MLDASTQLPVPGSDVLAWADLDSPDLVWALPARPRIATAQDGLPDVSLLLYRRGAAAKPDGGQLNLTVDLALTQGEREAAAAAGAARRTPPRPGEPEPPPVEVKAPSWIDGKVHARLASGVEADGQPSLLGDNGCLLALQLDATQAAAVQDAWSAGFPDATVELDGTIDAANAGAAAASTARFAHNSTPGCEQTSTHTHTVAAGARNAVRLPLRLHGPLRLPPAAKTTRRTDLTL